MRKPKAVVFDIGNVLIEWRPERVYASLIPDVARRERFFRETGLLDVNLNVDRGAPFPRTIYDHADRFPEYRDWIRAWADRWIEMASPAIPGTVALLRRLKAKGVPVHALSNFGAETFEQACLAYPFLLEFDVPVISGREGTVKPEPRIYELLEDRTGLLAQDIFYTDDVAQNIGAARGRFWQAELFLSPEKLAQDLVRLGVLAPDDVPDIARAPTR